MDSILVYKRELIDNKLLNAIVGVGFFIIATALGAYIRIPVPGTPVPITLQTFFVVLSGAVLGKKLGLLSQAGYLFLGAAGLPVFQGYAFGAVHMFGPTGGYLAGFLLASFLTGKLLEKEEPGFLRIIAAFAIGNIALYTLGVFWLMFLYKISLFNAVAIGVLPFFAVELIKVTAAAFIYCGISHRTKSIFS